LTDAFQQRRLFRRRPGPGCQRPDSSPICWTPWASELRPANGPVQVLQDGRRPLIPHDECRQHPAHGRPGVYLHDVVDVQPATLRACPWPLPWAPFLGGSFPRCRDEKYSSHGFWASGRAMIILAGLLNWLPLRRGNRTDGLEAGLAVGMSSSSARCRRSASDSTRLHGMVYALACTLRRPSRYDDATAMLWPWERPFCEGRRLRRKAAIAMTVFGLLGVLLAATCEVAFR